MWRFKLKSWTIFRNIKSTLAIATMNNRDKKKNIKYIFCSEKSTHRMIHNRMNWRIDLFELIRFACPYFIIFTFARFFSSCNLFVIFFLSSSGLQQILIAAHTLAQLLLLLRWRYLVINYYHWNRMDSIKQKKRYQTDFWILKWCDHRLLSFCWFWFEWRIDTKQHKISRNGDGMTVKIKTKRIVSKLQKRNIYKMI